MQEITARFSAMVFALAHLLATEATAQDGAVSVPLGVGIGQVTKHGKTVYNMFIEPQFSVADDRPGQSEWQIFLGFNKQFLN